MTVRPTSRPSGRPGAPAPASGLGFDTDTRGCTIRASWVRWQGVSLNRIAAIRGAGNGRLSNRNSVLRVLAAALIGGALLWFAAPTADAASSFKQNPILFVHGIEGTGAQFESQKMRFMGNGYPESWIDEGDYNSTRAVPGNGP